MSDFNYEIEDESDGQQSKPKVEIHQIRLSVDLHSIKGCEFQGAIYAKYHPLKQLGMKSQFRTTPSIPITSKGEQKLPNSFRSFNFKANSDQLLNLFSSNELVIEVWHHDRIKSDHKIGESLINMQNVLNAQLRKTAKSYAKVYDAYLPLDEYNEKGKVNQKLAELRVIIYLEDLGPTEGLAQRELEFDIKNSDKLEGEEKIIPQQHYLPLSYALQGSQKGNQILGEQQIGQGSGGIQQVNMMQDLGSLQYKIVWELETWKKSEEAKFKFLLKKKEIEFLEHLKESWKKKDLEKNRIFLIHQDKLNQIEQKMKNKSRDLKNREKNIIILEEELKSRLVQISKEVVEKEEKIAKQKKKFQADKKSLNKEKNKIEQQLNNLTNKYQQLEEEHYNFRQEQEASPISLIKNEVNSKNLEIQELQKELRKAEEIKEQYKMHYDKLKQEIMKLKKQNTELKDSIQDKNNQELELLKLQLNQMNMLQERGQLDQLRTEISSLKTNSLKNKISNPFKYNHAAPQPVSQQTSNKQQSQFSKIFMVGQQGQQENQQPNVDNMNERERLIYERNNLLKSGIYSQEDPLIKELDRQISSISS